MSNKLFVDYGLVDIIKYSLLRSKSTFKLSIRLPPTLNSQQARDTIFTLLTTNVPYNPKVTLGDFRATNGWSAPTYSPYLKSAIEQASNTYFKRRYLAISEGMGIPLIGMLQQAFPESEFIITGVLGPESNAHGPNEFLHLGYCEKLINCMTLILARVSEHYQKKNEQK